MICNWLRIPDLASTETSSETYSGAVIMMGRGRVEKGKKKKKIGGIKGKEGVGALLLLLYLFFRRFFFRPFLLSFAPLTAPAIQDIITWNTSRKVQNCQLRNVQHVSTISSLRNVAPLSPMLRWHNFFWTLASWRSTLKGKEREERGQRSNKCHQYCGSPRMAFGFMDCFLREH